MATKTKAKTLAAKATKATLRYAWQGSKGKGGAKRGLLWVGDQMATPFDPEKRREWALRRKAAAQRRRKWVNVDGGHKPSARPTPVLPALVRTGWGCPKCGEGGGTLAAKNAHKCDPAALKTKKRERAVRTRIVKVRTADATPPARPGEVKPSRPGHKVIKTTKGKPRTAPVPPAPPTPMRGARIVRANTAAERFALLATAEPETSFEAEQLFNDMVQGFLCLGNELVDLAEDRMDLDPRIKDAIFRLSDKVMDLMEPAREVRLVFRTVYAPWLEAAPVRLPKNADKFFGHTA